LLGMHCGLQVILGGRCALVAFDAEALHFGAF
jgi:hypothetical protein